MLPILKSWPEMCGRPFDDQNSSQRFMSRSWCMMRGVPLDRERDSRSRRDSEKVDVVRWCARSVVGSRGGLYERTSALSPANQERNDAFRTH